MGTTLQHGIFLPAEGERNCYAGLASNWTILDGMIGGYSSHAANLTIHVTAEDKQAWNGKADASALTAHTGNTAIHVTAEDKQAWNGHVADSVKHVTAEDKAKWDAVTSKANDSDVVHNSGDETVGGQKTFSHVQIGVGRDLYLFTPNSYSKDTPPANISYQYIWFTGNSASQGLTNNWYGGYIEHRVYPNGSAHSRWFVRDTSESGLGIELFINGNDKQLRPQGNNIIDLGTPKNKWKSFNGLNPGALSLPDLSNGIDISSYITHLDKVANNYTPPSNGWLSIRVKKTSLAHTSIMIYQTGGLLSSCETTEFSISGTNLPVIANQKVEIYIIADSLASAIFFPCQGNV